KNEQPIETFRANGADEALCDRVRLRRTHGSLHDPDAFAAEDLVEGGAVLAVAVTDQEADALVGEIETEVACLLVHPRAGRVLRAAGQPNASARMSDEEEHVVAAEHDALDCEEITGDDAGRLRSQELAPARAVAAWPRFQLRMSKQPPDARRRDAEAELGQLTSDPPVTPVRVLACESQ